MTGGEPLPADQLYRPCDPDALDFETTEELHDLPVAVGQTRAVDAIRFGIGIRHEGYHLFALGPPGAGKHTVVRAEIASRARAAPAPSDWCYVYNFEHEHRPRALELPPGRATRFRDDMSRLVDDLRTGVVAAFENEEYRTRHQEIDEEFSDRQQQAFAEIRDRAAKKDIALIHGPTGVALAPMRDGKVIDTEAFKELPDEDQARYREAISEFEDQIERIIRQLPQWRRETQHKLRDLKREVTRAAVAGLIDDVEAGYADVASVVEYLAAVERDVIEHAEDFWRSSDAEASPAAGITQMLGGAPSPSLRRYQVNVLQERVGDGGAPIVYEDHPTYQNLVGRIEHRAHMGALVTDFGLIKSGALHRANGGYLVVDAHRVLTQPFAWEGLKRALRSREIRTESLGQMLSLVSTASLEPEPIPLSLKVVLVGERWIYYLLHEHDPEFADLFKVSVDFEDSTPRADGGEALYARWVATIARRERLRPFERAAVARVIEHSARLAGDSEKLSTALRDLTELLRESDHWAGVAERPGVDAAAVQQALDERRHRSDRVRVRLQEEIARGTILIETEASVVGQVNGLAVVDLGRYAFGRPTRITARVRMGAGRVVDIEREVELGGPLHSKGVLILSGFLAGHYLPAQPLSLAASVVFEQSYGVVDGDSASSAELYALLSALANLPLRQSLAVTGSVNQLGDVQAIGGVNEKIEGFFDICRARGLSGEQGVIIPAANVRHLMLKESVVEAVAAGRFHVYPVETIDQGISLLTGMPAGARDAAGNFSEPGVHARVERRLLDFAAEARALRTGTEAGEAS